MEKFSADEVLYLVSHRGGAAAKLNCVILELHVGETPEDAAAGKSRRLVVAMPADYARIVIASIQRSLASLQSTN